MNTDISNNLLPGHEVIMIIQQVLDIGIPERHSNSFLAD
jgi:hypothetical protein